MTSEFCNDTNMGGDGVVRTCDKPPGHAGLHGQTVFLRRSTGDEMYPSTTNWGDDGKGIHATRGRLIDGLWDDERKDK